ncbi:SCO family protein [soil metagenome]
MKTRLDHALLTIGRLARAVVVLCVMAGIFGAPRTAQAQVAGMPKELEHVGVREHLDGPLPLETPFRDHTGKAVKLGDYYDGKRPVVLTFAYHSCPVLCGMVLNNAAAGLRGIGWTVGKEFDVVTISIDPEEALEKTATKRASILNEYGASRGHDGKGWHFLVGSKESIAKVAAAAGFEYQYDPEIKQWGHPSVVMITKPDGRMARYLYGLEFPAADLKLGLLEASEGRSISTIEQIILYCYHYDPQGGKYVVVAQRVMQVGGGAVAIVLFGFLGLFWGRELRKSKSKSNSKSSPPSDSPADVTV